MKAGPVNNLQPCLVPFEIWQEVEEPDEELLANRTNSSHIANVKNKVRDTLLDTNEELECELASGLYFGNVCHYYEVITDLCVKVDFEFDDNSKVTNVLYDSGCYYDDEASKF